MRRSICQAPPPNPSREHFTREAKPAAQRSNCRLADAEPNPPLNRATPTRGEGGHPPCAHRVRCGADAVTGQGKLKPSDPARRAQKERGIVELHSLRLHRPETSRKHPMPEIVLAIPGLLTQDDADAVMFELQDLPCVNRGEVDLQTQRVWVDHTAMISVDDIAAALKEAGYEAQPLES